MPIDDSELSDFKATLRRHGLSEGDFEVISLENSLPVGTVSPLTGKVTIKNKKTGVGRTYKAGHGTAWVVRFEEDVKSDHFVA